MTSGTRIPQAPGNGSFRRGELKRSIRANFEASAAASDEQTSALLDLVGIPGLDHSSVSWRQSAMLDIRMRMIWQSKLQFTSTLQTSQCPVYIAHRDVLPGSVGQACCSPKQHAEALHGMQMQTIWLCRALTRCGSLRSSSPWSSVVAPPAHRACLWRSPQPR